jgi:hypothetical protein
MKAVSRLLPVALALALAPGARAAGPCLTARDLARLNACQLDALFAAATVGELPVGLGRGRILLRVDGKKMPRVRARLQGLVWKGKFFHPDGSFVNQWAGFRAISSTVAVGPSWHDGRPCLVLEYPPGTPVFGNARDELRELAPGVWLGRFYARCPCGRLEGYFVLELACGK